MLRVLLGAVQASASPLHLAHISSVCVGEHRAVSGVKFWERIRRADKLMANVWLWFPQPSTLGSIRKSLVPLNHQFLNRTLKCSLGDGLLQPVSVPGSGISWCLQRSFFPECCCHDHGENPSPLSVFHLTAAPVVFSTFEIPAKAQHRFDFVAGLINCSSSKCCFSEV